MFNILAIVSTAGYLGVAGIVFAESGLLIGIILPGDSVLFTAGLLASQGHLNIFILIALAWIAAVVGDNVGYWLGKRYGPSVFSRQNSFFLNPGHIHRAESFYERHGAKAIVLARFLPVIRTLAPVLAGVGSMRRNTFFSYNVVGAFLWAMGIPLLGYWLGATVPNVDHYLVPIIIAIIFISIIPTLWEYFASR